MDSRIRELMMTKTPASTIREAVRKTGVKSLPENGLDKVFKGITTIEEVLRETQSEE